MVGVRGPPLGFKKIDHFGRSLTAHLQTDLPIGNQKILRSFHEEVCRTEAMHGEELGKVHDYAEEAQKLFEKVGLTTDSIDGDGGDDLRHFFEPDCVYRHPNGAGLFIGGQGPASNR